MTIGNTAAVTASTTAAKSIRSRKKVEAIASTPSAAAFQASVPQEQLKRALAKAQHAVAPKSTLPVLGNVLLVAARNQLTISATNLEIGIVVALPHRSRAPARSRCRPSCSPTWSAACPMRRSPWTWTRAI